MVKDAWNSFKDNIKDRITNPFLGTFVVVWIAHNWQVVYSFFYFDKESKLEDKIQYFKNYWTDKSFFWNLICVAAITVGILIITYLFLALSRYLANIFENIVVPNIQRISKGKIVTAETHQTALDRINSLEAKFESERKSKNEAIAERDEFEKRLYQNTSSVIDSDEVKITSDYSDLINLANTTNDPNLFEKTLLKISKGSAFRNDNKEIDFLLKHNLIEFMTNNTSGYPIYKFTPKGNEFKDQYFQTK